MVSRREHCLSLAKHGHYGTPTYSSWIEMRRRCRANGRDNSRYYSERNITVSAEWSDFGTFLADMGERPTPSHTIDRIDPNGNYEPGNCRWVTITEQNNNRRNNRYVTYRGLTVSLRTALRMAGDIVEQSLARQRLIKGWSIEAAVETLPLARMVQGHWRTKGNKTFWINEHQKRKRASRGRASDL